MLATSHEGNPSNALDSVGDVSKGTRVCVNPKSYANIDLGADRVGVTTYGPSVSPIPFPAAELAPVATSVCGVKCAR